MNGNNSFSIWKSDGVDISLNHSDDKLTDNIQALKIFRKLITYPSIEDIHVKKLNENNIHIQVILNQYNNCLKQSMKSLTDYNIDLSSGCSLPIYSSMNLDCEQRLVLQSFEFSKTVSIIQDQSKTNILINDSQGLSLFVNSEKIEKVYCPLRDFGTIKWSPDGMFLIFMVKFKSADKGDNSFEEIISNRNFEKPVMLGEETSDIQNFEIAILETITGNIEYIQTPANHIPTQFCWSVESSKFYFIGVRNDDFGLLHCTNQPSSIFSYTIDKSNKDCDIVCNEKNITYHSLRSSPKNHTLIYTRNRINGPHSHCRAVFALIDNKECELIQAVDDNLNNSEYMGLYEDLPEKCWLDDGSGFVFHASNGFYKNLHVFKFTNKYEGKLFHIATLNKGCWEVKNVKENRVIAMFSSISCEPRLMISTEIKINQDIVEINWTQIVKLHEPFINIRMRNQICSNIHNSYKEEAMLISCTEWQDSPSVFIAHGGPNVHFTDSFTQIKAIALAACGFNVILLNYIGSTGYGQRSLDYLTGNVMKHDVDSCLRLIRLSIEHFKIDANKLFYNGGSHSGAIGIALLSQHRELFKAACLVNPVCDYLHLLFTSDIPNYVYHQLFNKPYETKRFYTQDVISSLNEQSPMLNCSNIKTPLLLCLGKNDLRVPYQACLRLKRILEANNTAVSLRMYPDGHGCKNQVHSTDIFVHMFKWFKQYL